MTYSSPSRTILDSIFVASLLATSGSAEDPRADVDFGSHGVKRLAVRHAPIEKL